MGRRIDDGASVVDGWCRVVVVGEQVVDGETDVDGVVDGASVVDGWCRWPVEAGVVERVVDGETVVVRGVDVCGEEVEAGAAVGR